MRRMRILGIAAVTLSIFAWPIASAQAATYQGRYPGATSQHLAYSMTLTNAKAGQLEPGYMTWSVTTRIIFTCPNGLVTELDSFSSIPVKPSPTGHYSAVVGSGSSGEFDQGVFSGDRVTGTMHDSWSIKGKTCTTGLITFSATRTKGASTGTHQTTRAVACPNWNDFKNLTSYSKVQAKGIACAQARIVEQGFLSSLDRGSGPSGPVHVGAFACRDRLHLGVNKLSGAGSCVNGAGGSLTFMATVHAQ